jgi:hypothetical protein
MAAVITSVGYLTFVQQRFYFRVDFFYVFLLMPATLAVVSLLRDVRLPASPTIVYAALVIVMFVLAFVDILINQSVYEWWKDNSWFISLGASIAVLAAAALSVFLQNCHYGVIRSLFLFSSLALLFGLSRSHPYGEAFFEGDRPPYRDGYARVKQGIDFIRDNYHGSYHNFWLMDGPADEIWLFRSFMRCESEFAYPARLPDPRVHWQQSVTEADGLIVVANEPTLSSVAQETLAGAGVGASVYESKEIRSGGVAYYVLLLDLSPLPRT